MSDSKTAAFVALRPRLFGLAYRMLGLRQDAEDAVHDAYLRWHEADTAAVVSAEAWLVSTTTRLCIDRLRRLKHEREAYFGPWLPEPLLQADLATPEFQLELAHDVSIAFLSLLERLSPEERAAFVLHEVFEFDYDEIAAALDRSQGACRQLVHRAKSRLQRDEARFAVSEARHRDLLERFIAASTSGDHAALMALLTEDVTFNADGGGKVQVVFKTLHGAERVARLFQTLSRRAADAGASMTLEPIQLNGETALLRRFNGQPHSIVAFETDGARFTQVFILANPDKLQALGTPLR